MTMIDDLRQIVNPILGIRDDLGAVKASVYLIARTWTGTEPGDGRFIDTETQVLPSPNIVMFMDDYRIKEGGAVQQGDIKLKWISKQSFPDRTMIDCSVESQNVERFYRVGNYLYRLIQVEEKLLSWNVLLRRLSNQ